MTVLHREFVYIWYYFDLQLRQIFWYWVAGILIGSFISVFAKKRIHRLFESMRGWKMGVLGVVPASVLGILSPLCMYGTIPIAASFAGKGMREDWIAAFMMSSILLNPQLLIYSMALGNVMCMIRLVSCLLCGILAGVIIWAAYVKKGTGEPVPVVSEGTREPVPVVFFDFAGFGEGSDHDTDPRIAVRYLKNVWRNLRATGVYFFLGILLSALFQRYVPASLITQFLGGNKAWGVLLAATVGVPVYVCGGGTIPLLQQWLAQGMSCGSATAFMITGPATKITNLGALKSVLGIKHFIFYIAFVMLYSFLCGLLINMFF